MSLGGALAALVFLIFILTPPKPRLPEFSKPTSEDQGRYGLYGLKQWLQHTGVPHISLRKAYPELEKAVGPKGNLLIAYGIASVTPLHQETEFLSQWINKGNTLLLLTGENDTQLEVNNRLLSHFGFEFHLPEDDEQQSEKEKAAKDIKKSIQKLSKLLRDSAFEDATVQPLIDHPLNSGVESIHARRFKPTKQSSSLLSNTALALKLLGDEHFGPVFWEARFGEGRIYISRYADLFGNVNLGKKDNARLFANLSNISLGPQGQVIFDDFHFGLSDLYDPDAFFADSRLHNTIWFVFAFWVIYILGHGNRYGPPQKTKTFVKGEDFIRAIGGYFAQSVDRWSAAESLYKHFFNDVRTIYKHPRNGQPVWDLLARNPRVDAKLLQLCKSSFYKQDPKVDLIQLQNRLLTIKEKLTS